MWSIIIMMKNSTESFFAPKQKNGQFQQTIATMYQEVQVSFINSKIGEERR